MKLNSALTLTSLALCTVLTACGGGGSSKPAPTPTPTPTPTPKAPTQGKVLGPHSTGSISAPVFVYFDLETQKVINLTPEQAATNSVWDIAFKRSGVYLNQHKDNTVKAYATGNNKDFFDADGKAIAASFTAATAETELADYLAVKKSNIPTDNDKFIGDITSNIISKFYSYNSTTHKISVADKNYFIVNSDEAYTKFRATSITTVGRGLGKITLQAAYQGVGDAKFSAEKEIAIDASLICSGDVTHAYVDFDTNQVVTKADAWDINLPCKSDKSGAEFTINIADDAKAIQDFKNRYTAIDAAAVSFMGFKKNVYSIKAFDKTPWYQYGLNGGHLLWSQFDIYLIKTPTKTHKLQITSYYNAEGKSGNISFRADEVNELAGTASK